MSAPEDQTGMMWSDPAWPWRPLNRSTALQYFEHSPFYDPNSNNAAARAQNLDPSNEAVLRALPPDRPEFVLAEVQEPHLFVVRRQLRAAPPGPGAGGAGAGAAAAAGGRAATQAVYYVLGDAGHAYQAPSLHAALHARLRRCMHFVRVGFGRFKRDLAPLPKLLRAQQRHQAQQAELAEREAREREQLRRAAATGALGADAAARVAAAGGEASGGAGGAAVAAAAEGGLAALQCTDSKPMELPEVLSMAERQHWERTDEIIMNVLRRYRAPRLPPLDGDAEAEAKAAAEEQQQRQQQQQQQQQQEAAQKALRQTPPPAALAAVKAEPKQEPAAADAAALKREAQTRQPAVRPAPAGGAGPRGGQPGAGLGGNAGVEPALLAASQAQSHSHSQPQPSGGSVLTASRAPKVRIKLPRSSGGGGGSGGGAAPGGEQPAAKRAKQ